MDVGLLSLLMSFYNWSDSTEGKWKAEISKEGDAPARPWSLLLRSWYAGLENTLGAYICAETGGDELSRVVCNYSTCRKVAFERPISKHIQRLFLVCVGPSFLLCWLEVRKKWSLSKDTNWSAILMLLFFFRFHLFCQFFLNYPLWTKHRG